MSILLSIVCYVVFLASPCYCILLCLLGTLCSRAQCTCYVLVFLFIVLVFMSCLQSSFYCWDVTSHLHPVVFWWILKKSRKNSEEIHHLNDSTSDHSNHKQPIICTMSNLWEKILTFLWYFNLSKLDLRNSTRDKTPETS